MGEEFRKHSMECSDLHRIHIQDGFFTHMSGTSIFFQGASVSRKFLLVHSPHPKGKHSPNLSQCRFICLVQYFMYVHGDIFASDFFHLVLCLWDPHCYVVSSYIFHCVNRPHFIHFSVSGYVGTSLSGAIKNDSCPKRFGSGDRVLPAMKVHVFDQNRT